MDKASLFAALAPRVVLVSGISAAIYVREFDGSTRDKFDSWLRSHRGPDGETRTDGMREFVAMLSACDASGMRIFTDEDLPKLSELSSVAVTAIFEAAARINGLLDAGEAKQGF